MTISLEQFQKAVGERRRERKHGARRYESELVSFAVAHARAVVESGRSLHVASKELGVTMSTLQSWQQRDAESGDALRLREVVVADGPFDAVRSCALVSPVYRLPVHR